MLNTTITNKGKKMSKYTSYKSFKASLKEEEQKFLDKKTSAKIKKQAQDIYDLADKSLEKLPGDTRSRANMEEIQMKAGNIVSSKEIDTEKQAWVVHTLGSLFNRNKEKPTNDKRPLSKRK